MQLSLSAGKKRYQTFRNIDCLGPLIALLILIITLSFASKHFFSLNNFFNIIQQSSINLIIALGMTVVLISGGIDLSVGSVLALTGCSIGLLVVKFGFNPAVAIFLGLVLGSLVGAFN